VAASPAPSIISIHFVPHQPGPAYRLERILLAGALLSAVACAGRGAPRQHAVTVSAAASLREVLRELEVSYEAEHPDTDIRVNLGASGALRRQIEQGAPVDVFISASDEPMDALVGAGLMDGRSRRSLASNQLVVIVPAGSTLRIARLADLARPEVRRIALGAPASVPAGAYADQALRAAGLSAALEGRAVLAQDVRQVLAFVASGNADAGIVYRTDAAVSSQVRIAAEVHPTLHRRIGYPLAVATRPSDVARSRDFAAYLLGPSGRAVLRRRGFGVE
jgi:molybdate transport system substrate-binding protein